MKSAFAGQISAALRKIVSGVCRQSDYVSGLMKNRRSELPPRVVRIRGGGRVAVEYDRIDGW